MLNGEEKIMNPILNKTRKRRINLFEIEEFAKCYKIKIFCFKFKFIKKNIYNIPNYYELIEKGTLFPHLSGIVISKASEIGHNCIIYQDVTIGARTVQEGDCAKPQNYPKIGNNVTIYAGAKILGAIKVGDNAIIGANAVVLSDVPENSVAVGVPAIVKGKIER